MNRIVCGVARVPIILKNTVVYAVFNAMTSLIPFFLLPILTRYLSPADYGTLSVFAILVFLLTPFLRLELMAALRRFFFESRQDFTADVGCALTLSLIIFLGFCGAWLVGSFFTSTFFEIPMPWVLAAVVVALGGTLTTVLVSLYQMQGKAFQVGTRSLLITALIFVPTVVLIAYFGFDWRGRTWTQLVVALAIEIPTSVYFIHRMFPFRLNLDRSRVRDLLKFSVPLIPVTLASYLLMTTDRLLLNHFLTLETVGLYTVAVQITSSVRLLLNAFNSSWETWLFGTLNTPTERNLARVVLVLYAFLIGTLIAVLGLIYVLPIALPWIAGERYQDSFQFIGWLAFAEMLKAMSIVLQSFFMYKKNTAILNYILVAQAVINFILAYVLVQSQGAIGVAQASLISAALGLGICVFLVRRYYDLPWLKFLKILKPWQKGVRSVSQ